MQNIKMDASSTAWQLLQDLLYKFKNVPVPTPIYFLPVNPPSQGKIAVNSPLRITETHGKHILLR